jgi:Cu+-exporting ATPase
LRHEDNPELRAISEATVANMKQNLGFAFAYNALGIPIAALAMSLDSVSVASNPLWLATRRFDMDGLGT